MGWVDDSDYQHSKEQVDREIAARRARGEIFEPVQAPKGNKLATSFWGQAWQRHLEGYADYESRLPRGRSYLRQGKVYNLEIGAGEVTAEVVGSMIYEVIVKIKPLTAPHWQEIKDKCAGQVGTLLDLLGGKMGDGVLKVITDREEGLFPGPREIRINCNCPDSAGLCKHAAAVLYGVGLKFDADPGLFFKLREVNPEDLLSLAADVLGKEPTASSAAVIEDDDLAGLFGIELGEIQPRPDPM